MFIKNKGLKPLVFDDDHYNLEMKHFDVDLWNNR